MLDRLHQAHVLVLCKQHQRRGQEKEKGEEGAAKEERVVKNGGRAYMEGEEKTYENEEAEEKRKRKRKTGRANARYLD